MALTERANLAGGHDNITVIVARLDGDGLREPGDDDEPLGYRKYALPEAASPEKTLPSPPLDSDAPVSSDRVPSSAGAQDLRVGHTVVGATSPLAEAGTESSPSQDSGPSSSPSDYDANDEPVQIPTTGFPPSIVGMMVVGAMVLVAITGFLLLR
jgi:protein phosphatase